MYCYYQENLYFTQRYDFPISIYGILRKRTASCGFRNLLSCICIHPFFFIQIFFTEKCENVNCLHLYWKFVKGLNQQCVVMLWCENCIHPSMFRICRCHATACHSLKTAPRGYTCYTSCAYASLSASLRDSLLSSLESLISITHNYTPTSLLRISPNFIFRHIFSFLVTKFFITCRHLAHPSISQQEGYFYGEI